MPVARVKFSEKSEPRRIFVELSDFAVSTPFPDQPNKVFLVASFVEYEKTGADAEIRIVKKRQIQREVASSINATVASSVASLVTYLQAEHDAVRTAELLPPPSP